MDRPITKTEARLLELFQERSFRRAPPGQPFRLASGATSDYFIDGKMTAVHAEGATLIGEVLYEHTKDLEFDAIGGLQVGAVPLVTAAVIAYHRHGRRLEGFWVREEVKDHGTRKSIEGGLRPGARVIIVDDVFTKGGSALKAVEAVREAGCEVVLVLALVDRLQGARELFRQNCIESYKSVYTIRDFGIGPMYPAQLKPLLIKGVFAPNSVTAVAALCDDWFRNDASLESFTFRSTFRDLIVRGWDDPQGIPTADFDRFVDDVLPRLTAVLAVLPGDPSAALRDLALAYHSSN